VKLTEHPDFRIYHDLDGVHADIAAALLALGIVNGQVTDHAFWAAVDSVPDFFRRLARLPDSALLWDYTAAYPRSVLTGLPLRNRADEQKREWVREHLCPDVEVIVKPARRKAEHAAPHTVLIDDTERNVQWWREAGGIGILHTSAKDTIAQLRELGI